MKNSTQAMLNVPRVPKRHENDLSRVKHIVRKAAALFVFAMFVACAATPAMAAGLAKITDIQGGGGASKSVGTGADTKYVAKSPDRTIYFGNYWQTLKDETKSRDVSGYDKEGIQWRVLANNATADANGNKGVLLLADQGLYADAINVDNGDGTYGHNHVTSADANRWKISDIRDTLNNRTAGSGFAGDAFSAKEWSAIAETTHKVGGIYTGSADQSIDKLFLLSAEEATSTDYGFTGTAGATVIRKASPTAFAKSVKMYGNGNVANVSPSGAAWWWLRSPGDLDSNAYYVGADGYVSDLSYVYNDDGAARVAFNLNQESVLFLSAAVGGKTSVAVGNGFKLADYDGSQGWKMTMNDAYEKTSNPDGIKAPTDVTVTQPTDGKGVNNIAEITPEGGTIDLTKGVSEDLGAPVVAYTAAAIKDGKANCVSAILVSGDKYINYAKISSEDSETAKEVPFGNLADGRYTMYIFAEQVSGDKQTDYASAFSNGDGYEFIKGSGETVKTGNLSKEYKDKDLTVKLGGGFDLGFENAEYVTKITVVDGDHNNKLTVGVNDTKSAGFLAAIDTVLGTEIASDTDGTTLKGKVTVEETAQVTCCGKTTFMDLEVYGDLTIENGAVVEVKKVQTGEDGTIFMKENAELVNNSGEEITVQYVRADGSTEEVTIKDGYKYKPSEGEPKPSQEEPSKGGSSGGGCNAGFGIAMLLSAAAAMICKRKRG